MQRILPVISAVAILMAQSTTAWAVGEPRLELSPQERWMLTGLPDLLAEDEVKQHLLTGLTTSFNFQLYLRGLNSGKPVGAAQVDVRYELWDEVFHVAVLDLTGHREPAILPSFEALRNWWRELRLTILAPTTSRSSPAVARVSVDVVPFSASETAEAQRWLAESVKDPPTSGPEEIAKLAEEPFEPLDRVLSLLLKTSIKRRALLSFSWSIPTPDAAG